MSKLRQRMTQDLKIRNYSPRTIEVYINRVAKFAQYFGKSPDRLGPAEIREFQHYLVEEKKCSWSLLNQTVCALRFFYGVCLNKPWMIQHIPLARQPRKLPVVLSRDEVSELFEATDNLKHRTLLMTLYGTGLRLSEALALQVQDIDSRRMLIRIRHGKGAKDRYVPLFPALLEQLRRYWIRQRACVAVSGPGSPSTAYARRFLATHSASPEQRRVISDLIACRSAVLGGHLRRCQQCGHEEIAYNSCRNRHCPKCQGQKQADWLQAQCANLLDVPYFHIVFTLPQSLSPLALQNQPLLYGLLFRCASRALLGIARDPKHLGARIGFTAILDTWGQTLMHHPHLHCLVPAGGLSPNKERWIPAREQFFLPVRVLSRFFRGTYLTGLRQAYQEGQLRLEGQLQELADPRRWEAFLEALARPEWVVYAKPLLARPGRCWPT